jgi:3-hydroxy-9,10-secoandrosta-1,3,5(10)-triene-9,17-dione monooxygenase reductase component
MGGDATAAVDVEAYRDAIGRFTTGVAVVTSVGENGPSGLTLSALCSLSIEPLMVLACLDRGSRTLAAIRQTRRCAINVLATGQREVAIGFAGKAPEREKFAGVGWTEVDGMPVLDGVVSWLTGDVEELVPGGDHLIAVIRVARLGVPGGEPLVYHRGRFHALAELDRG